MYRARKGIKRLKRNVQNSDTCEVSDSYTRLMESIKDSPGKQYKFTVSWILVFALTLGSAAGIHAEPQGGIIVGGSGNIHLQSQTTTIHQNTSSLAINWNSFNVSKDEVVNFLQPDTSSIALNRILSQSGTEIFGRINANGHVVLVNPNGIFFGQNASVNVGGLIASGLDIKPTDFMNGEYLFQSIAGSDGQVINSGLLNASLGGSISLIGKQVENNGLIVANLGAVNLATGKEAVVTFGDVGLVGVRVSEAILQDELGVDPAVLNSGEIKAEGGRILLTASQSRDIFSSAVNTGGIEQATSVVLHEDGSFTLGGGSAVINTGSIDVSSYESGKQAGQIVVLSENITSSGVIAENGQGANGGQIELHSQDTTLLTESSQTTAVAYDDGKGGKVKVLGENVGLFDHSLVDASGATGGGEVLIGGDRQGLNSNIRKAEFIYLGEETEVKTDAINHGNGGKLITFATDTARIYGDLSSRGGTDGGNGGFIETSGKRDFEILKTPDLSASSGEGGLWLIDPNNIDIVGGNVNTNINNTNPFVSTDDDAVLGVDLIEAALLTSNADVTITTASAGANSQDGDITFDADLNYDGIGTGNTLSLNAAGDILFFSNRKIEDTDTGTADSLSLNLFAAGSVTLNPGVVIETNGGNFTVGDTSNNFIPTSFTNSGTINTSSDDGGGNIAITSSGNVTLGAMDVHDSANNSASDSGGSIVVHSGGDITLDVDYDYDDTFGAESGTNPLFELNADNSININAQIFDSGVGAIDAQNIIFNADKDNNGSGDVNITAKISTSNGDFTVMGGNTFNNSNASGDILAGSGAVSITTSGDTVGDGSGIGINLGRIETTGIFSLNANGGSITQTSSTSNELRISGLTTLNSSSDITLNNEDNRLGTVATTRAVNLTLVDNTGGADLGATDIYGNISVSANDNSNGSDITQSGVLTIAGTSTFSTTSDDVILENSANDFIGAVSSSGSVDAFRITDSNDLQIGGITVTDNSGPAIRLTALNNGNITQQDGTRINMASSGGVAELMAEGNSITLTNATGSINDFHTVKLTADTVDLYEAGTIRLSDSTVTNSLSITAGINSNDGNTAIRDIGGSSISVTGVTTLTAGNTTSTDNNIHIVLDSTGGDYNTINIINADNVTMVDKVGSMAIQGKIRDSLTLTSTETVFSGEVIINSGALTVGASTTVTVENGQSVNLSHVGNSFANNPIFSGNINNLAITDTTDLTLQNNLNLTGNLTATANNLSLQNTTVGGNLTATASNASGQINDTGAITVSGLTNLTATGGSITLDNANDFTGAVSLTAQDATVRDASSIILGDSTISNDLTITADNGSITQLGSGLDINGSSIFNSTDAINLTNVNNDFTGNVSLTNTGSNVVQITDINAITLGGASLFGGDFSVNATQTNLNAVAAITTNGGDVTFNGPVVLLQNSSINTGTGKIEFTAMLDATTARVETLTLAAGDIDLNSDAGNAIRLGALTIDSTGIVNAVNHSISTDSLTVLSSSSFTSGMIDAQGAAAATDSNGNNGGNVTISSGNITVAAVLTQGSTSNGAGTDGGNGGTVALNATDNSTNGAPRITLNGDINTQGGATANAGTAGEVTLTLAGNNNPTGTLSLNHSTDFTSAITLTGSTGNDALIAPDRENNWDIDNANSGTLNSNVTFTAIENLTGNDGLDTFNFTHNTSSISGVIDGGNGIADNIDLSSIAMVSVDLSASGNFTGIETYTGNNFDSTLSAENLSNSWTIDGSNSGNVTNANGAITFTGFTDLVGNDAIDNFTLTGDGTTTGVLTGTINGGIGNDSLTVIHTVADVSWNISGNNQGAVSGLNGGVIDGFSEIENLSGGDQSDTFSFQAAGNITGNIDAGAGTDTVDYSSQATVTVNLANAFNGVSDAELIRGNGTASTLMADDVNNTWSINGENYGTVAGINFIDFNTLIGGSGDDTFTLTAGGSVTGLIDGAGQVAGDRLVATALASGNNWILATDNDGVLNASIHFNGIEILNGNGDALSGPSLVANNWILTENNAGGLNGNMTFSGMDSINGGTTIDTLNAPVGNNIWTIISNGNGDLNSVLSFSGMDIHNGSINDDSFTLANAVTSGIYNGYDLLGTGADTGNDSLTGAVVAGGNDWAINADAAGTINTDIDFDGMETLQGNTGIDRFA